VSIRADLVNRNHYNSGSRGLEIFNRKQIFRVSGGGDEISTRITPAGRKFGAGANFNPSTSTGSCAPPSALKRASKA